jgi:predicted pyridoxine 5'-phosphate oxidase superfamily flavin-nucleotide-binding protein
MNNTYDRIDDPFHAGERAVHAKLGIEQKMLGIGQRVIRDFMPEQHQRFYEQLPMVVVGAVDAEGQPWASVLCGAPGFIRAESADRLRVRARAPVGDPLGRLLVPGAALGMLGIELQTRRRNRVNGRVAAVADDGFCLQVEQTVGNCPKYIQTRELDATPTSHGAGAVESMAALDADAMALLARSDTLFIATHAAPSGDRAAGGSDVSHRGGHPGFIVQESARQFLVPDYAGNALFMTIGNLQRNPRAGVLVIDFDSGDLLSLAGRVEMVWDRSAVAHLPGAERAWRFHVDQVVRMRSALPLRWRFRAWSPFLPGVAPV